MASTHGKGSRCYCGCGQAPGTTCRQRLLQCDGWTPDGPCGVKLRQSREALAKVTVSCSCGGTYVPICLEDQARTGDASAAVALDGRVMRQAIASDAGKRSGAVRRARKRVQGMTPEERALETVASGGNTALLSTRELFQARDALEANPPQWKGHDDIPF